MLSFHRKSLYTVITIIGLGYFVAYATIQFMADWIGGTIPFFDYYHVPFFDYYHVPFFDYYHVPFFDYYHVPFFDYYHVPFFDYYHVPFIVLFLLSVFLVWTRPRIGYLLSIIVGLVAVAIFTPFTFVKGLSSPANTGLFVYVMTVFPLILAAVSYSAI